MDDKTCRTCKHNSYLGIMKDWVSCGHPVTLTKQPRPEPGDPVWVDWMTADRHVARINMTDRCPAWEAGAVA